MMEDKTNSVKYECESCQAQESDVQMMTDVYGGISQMNKSSKTYLRQFYKESKEDYKDRKESSEFYNVTAGTINGVVGSVFSESIVTDEVPTQLKAMFDDIDLCGNDIATFLRESFKNAVRDGHSFIFVDAPPPVELPEGETADLADVIDRRAFWVNYKKNQAKNWQYEVINGKTVLTQITFKETTKEKEGRFGEKEATRFRVLMPGRWELYEEQTIDGKIVEAMVDSGPTSLNEIPLCVIYANQTGLLESNPPYLELARTNLKHYNSLSKFDFTLDFVAPMPVFTVNNKDDAVEFQKILMGANRSIILWGEHSDAKYLELTGASVQVLKERIESSEMRMAKMGIEKFAPIQDLSNKTAFEVGTDTQKEMSQVAVMAKNLEDAVEYALYFTGQQMNAIQGEKNAVKIKTRYSSEQTDGIEFKLQINYDRLSFSPEQLNFVKAMVDSKQLSLQTMWSWLPQVMKLPKGFSPETEKARLKEEASWNPQPMNGLPIAK